MKRGYIIIPVLFLMSISLVSAGFFEDIGNLFKKPNLAPSQQTDVSVTVGNTDPTIVSVPAISAVNLLAGTTTDVTVIFTAEDVNGASDLDSTTASASFNFSSESTRSSTPVTGCTAGTPSGNQITYNCTITMQYYDENAVWEVTATVDDQSSATATDNSETVTINLLRDITITPTTISFPGTTQGSTDVLSSSNTQITNNGNFDTVSDGSVEVTGTNLTGDTTPTESIPAINFRAADITDVGTVCSSGGSALVEATATGISGATLPRGISGSNTGNVTYCITSVPGGISSQSYSATTGKGIAWTIGI